MTEILNAEPDEDVRQRLAHIRSITPDREWRSRFCKLDQVILAEQQKAVLCSPFRYTYVQAGNQSGKTFVGGYWMICHALKRWPSFAASRYIPPAPPIAALGPRIMWIIGTTNVMTRDGPHRLLMGDAGHFGEGLLPAESIARIDNGRSIAGLSDSVHVRSDDGTETIIRFKSQEQSREALQSERVSAVWADELIVDMGLWNEILARTTVESAPILMTATPKRQQSPVVRWFREQSQ